VEKLEDVQSNSLRIYFVSWKVILEKIYYIINMEVINTEQFYGDKEIEEELGVVRGNSVQAKNIGRDFTQSIRNALGGELKAYQDLLTKTREKAIQEAKTEAEELGADAIVNLRLDTSDIASQGAEVVAYGTAVTLKEND
jgi:uncharacterized protein YbjQ (UPF0145 family)